MHCNCRRDCSYDCTLGSMTNCTFSNCTTACPVGQTNIPFGFCASTILAIVLCLFLVLIITGCICLFCLIDAIRNICSPCGKVFPSPAPTNAVPVPTDKPAADAEEPPPIEPVVVTDQVDDGFEEQEDAATESGEALEKEEDDEVNAGVADESKVEEPQ